MSYAIAVYFADNICDIPVYKATYDNLITLNDIPEKFSSVFEFQEKSQMIIADMTHLRHVRLSHLKPMKSVLCLAFK